MGTITRRVMLQALSGQALVVSAARGQAGQYQPPKPLSPDAVTHDWPSFLGPTHDAVSTETHLSRTLPPPGVWEFEKGTGYTSPAITGDAIPRATRRSTPTRRVTLTSIASPPGPSR